MGGGVRVRVTHRHLPRVGPKALERKWHRPALPAPARCGQLGDAQRRLVGLLVVERRRAIRTVAAAAAASNAATTATAATAAAATAATATTTAAAIAATTTVAAWPVDVDVGAVAQVQ